MKNKDIVTLAEIWLNTSLIAHHFIPEQYWLKNKNLMMEKYLPNSEVYVAEIDNSVYGFIALVENQIAALFVNTNQQGNGIGSSLLNHVKKLRSVLTLSVYSRNEKSVYFYTSHNFTILSESIEQVTREQEFTMQWKNNLI